MKLYRRLFFLTSLPWLCPLCDWLGSAILLIGPMIVGGQFVWNWGMKLTHWRSCPLPQAKRTPTTSQHSLIQTDLASPKMREPVEAK